MKVRPRRPLVLACAIAVLCGAANLRALDPATPLNQYGHDAWDGDSGLPQNTVTSILQSRNGYIWLGTQEGLVRFDGVRFAIFDTRNTKAMTDDWVQALCETRDGSLWVGTVTGLARYKDGAFTAFSDAGLGSAVILALFESRDGALWVGTSRGLARIHAEKVTLWTQQEGLPGPRVRAIAEDSAGDVWIGGNWGMARWHGGRFDSQKPSDGLTFSALALVSDGEGGIWAGTGKGLAHVGGESTRLYGAADGLSSGAILVLHRDREDSLWIGTENGLFRLRGGKILRYGPEGLTSQRIASLAEDREGNLWVGTTDGGLNRVKEQRIEIYTAKDGLSDNRIWTVLEDRAGNIWVGTAEGVLNRRPAGSHRFEVVARLGMQITAIAEDWRADLWVGTQGAGLARVRGHQVTRYTSEQGLSGNFISSVLVDRQGAVWVGTMGTGINRWDGRRFVNYRVRDGLGNDSIFSLFEDKDGDLWIGTFGGGITRLHAGTFQTYTTKDGLAHDVVMSTYQDSEGTFWFATRGGLSRFRDGTFTTYRQREGLFHDAAQQVLEDDHGYFWLTSNRGVFRVRRAELEAAAGGDRIRDAVTFQTAAGMIRAECNNAQHGAWRGRDGRLWFATIKGLAMADPDRIKLNAFAPAVVIEQAVADGQPQPSPADLKLPPGIRKLEFHYTALSFRNPLAVRFRYRLEGFERGWVNAGTRRIAYYTNLPPGRYRFRVLAANEDGVWNETGAAAAVVLDRHVWETDGFRILAGIVLVAAVVAGHRLRIARLKSRERHRTALVEAQLEALQFQIRPHFLFNTLNSMLPLIGGDPERARQMVVRLGDLLRLSLQSDATHLAPLENELSVLDHYLAIERVRFRDRLEVSVAVAPGAASALVPSFLLQPLVENAIKHGMSARGGRGRIRVEARPDGDSLAITIRDNGPGPSPDAASSPGIGLRNTRRRLEALYPGAHRFELVTGAEGGGEVRLRIPLVIAPGAGLPSDADREVSAPVSRAS